MAEKGTGGDWTAGILAIAAALLIGAAIPTGVYFGLYKPKQAQRMDAENRHAAMKIDEERAVAAVARVKKMQDEATQMEERVREIEKPFAVRDDKGDMQEVRSDLRAMCGKHSLGLREMYRHVFDADIVYVPLSKRQINFEHGLKGTTLFIEVQGTFHDFGRFLAELERWEKTTVIPEALDCIGDSNGERVHSFILQVCVIEKRDLGNVGT